MSDFERIALQIRSLPPVLYLRLISLLESKSVTTHYGRAVPKYSLYFFCLSDSFYFVIHPLQLMVDASFKVNVYNWICITSLLYGMPCISSSLICLVTTVYVRKTKKKFL